MSYHHLFPNTIEYFPYKWYKMEEARGETFIWKELKENFVKYLYFTPIEEPIKEEV